MLYETKYVHLNGDTQVAGSGQSCGSYEEEFTVNTKGIVSIDYESTFNEILASNESFISSKGLLKLIFSREVFFPRLTLAEFQPNYDPQPPQFNFKMTEEVFEKTPIKKEE